jgi:hypothetical protein
MKEALFGFLDAQRDDGHGGHQTRKDLRHRLRKHSLTQANRIGKAG